MEVLTKRLQKYWNQNKVSVRSFVGSAVLRDRRHIDRSSLHRNGHKSMDSSLTYIHNTKTVDNEKDSSDMNCSTV